jgi:hypothetical protein
VELGLEPEDRVIVGPYRAIMQLVDGKKVRVLKPKDDEAGDATGVAGDDAGAPATGTEDSASDAGTSSAASNG